MIRLLYLATSIEELLHDDLDLFEQDGIKSRRHFMTDQLLDVFLNLRAKFLVRAD